MSEAEVANDTGGEPARSGTRGAGFPVMDLLAAVGLIHKVGEYGGDFAKSTFAQYLGHTTANSGPYRTKVASLRDWGLVTSSGGRVLLTDLGKAVAKSAEPKEDQALLRSTFDSCKIFKSFYDNTAKGVELSVETLGRAAVFDHRVAAKSQDRFVSMLVDSAVAVGLATRDEAGTVTFNLAAAASTDTVASPLSGPDGTPDEVDSSASVRADADAAIRQQPAPPAPTAPIVLRQVWSTATGEVALVVHSTDPLPASAFDLVGKAVQAAEGLATSLGLPKDKDDDAS